MVVPQLNTLEVRLAPHPTGRNAAVAQKALKPGTVIASIPALSSCLLPTEKGNRCDECHRVKSESVNLLRCSRCASFWYCGASCQNKAWQSHHRKICKQYNAFIASNAYQALTSYDQVDSLLLSQLLAEPSIWYGRHAGQEILNDPVATFLDLLQVPRGDGFVPPLCLSRSTQTEETLALASDLYKRFCNNNFVLHSHLNSYAHGIFPLASRLFNHSCVPNAACKYIITPFESVRMEVVALYHVAEGEEIVIPYLDPALPWRTRQDALRLNYGFQCTCRLCTFQADLEPVPAPPSRGSSGLRELEAMLRTFSLGDISRDVQLPESPGVFERLPNELRSIFHESYLPALSEQFSKSSHEGPYADAVEAGLTLLALYAVIYPPNYPQMGMHALELAKTLWNLICTEPDSALIGANEEQLKRHAKTAVNFTSSVLCNFGPEGDEGGPLEEIRVLTQLLEEQ